MPRRKKMRQGVTCPQLWPNQSSPRPRMLHFLIKSSSCLSTTCNRKPLMSVWRKTLLFLKRTRKKGKSIIRCVSLWLAPKAPPQATVKPVNSSVDRTALPRLQWDLPSTVCLCWMRKSALKSREIRMRPGSLHQHQDLRKSNLREAL